VFSFGVFGVVDCSLPTPYLLYFKYSSGVVVDVVGALIVHCLHQFFCITTNLMVLLLM